MSVIKTPAAKEITPMLDRLQITYKHFSALVDEAGEVLAKHGVSRGGDTPAFIIPPNADDDTPNGALHIECRVETTPENAADMNWELLDRIVDRGLDVPGLTVGFAGVK